MIKAGLTGGIAAGKTFAAGIFVKLGVPVYFSDIQARILIDTDSRIISELKKMLGVDIYINGKIDKAKFSQYIFNEIKIRDKVNQIVHPIVWEDWEKWCNLQNAPYVLVESALLFQTGYYSSLDAVIVVDSDKTIRAERIVKRDGISLSEAETRINNQNFIIPEKAGTKLFTIENSRSGEMILPQVLKIHQNLKSL